MTFLSLAHHGAATEGSVTFSRSQYKNPIQSDSVLGGYDFRGLSVLRDAEDQDETGSFDDITGDAGGRYDGLRIGKTGGGGQSEYVSDVRARSTVPSLPGPVFTAADNRGVLSTVPERREGVGSFIRGIRQSAGFKPHCAAQCVAFRVGGSCRLWR